MSRRIVPGMFWVGILACAVLPPAGTMRASSPSGLPDVLGIWDGFFLAADGATGGVRSDVTQQDFKRLAGDGALLDLGGGDMEYQFAATLARPDFLTGTGVTSTGRLVFQADLATFAGRGGDAGVMAPEYHFVPSHGGANRVRRCCCIPSPASPRRTSPGVAWGFLSACPTRPTRASRPTRTSGASARCRSPRATTAAASPVAWISSSIPNRLPSFPGPSSRRPAMIAASS